MPCYSFSSVGSKFIEGSIHNIGVREILSHQPRHFAFNRIDIVIKYFAIEQYFGKNNFGYELYNRDLIFELNRLKSRIKRAGKKHRKTNKVRHRAIIHGLPKFKKLITSIQNGYDRESPIAINQYYQLCEGSHRLSCTLYFNYDTIPCVFSNQPVHCNCSIDQYKKIRFFKEKELDIIVEKTKKLIPPLDEKVALIVELEYIFNRESQNFGKGGFYQSYEPLGIKGMRPTAERFKQYRFDKYLSKQDRVLDIGCNCGFFSHYISSHVSRLDGFDNNISLIKMANLLKSFLKNNTYFTVNTFNRFESSSKYDFIIMAAIHKWLKSSPLEICDSIFKWLKREGIFFIESTKIEKHNKKMQDRKYDKICSILAQKFFQLSSGTIKDDKIIKRRFSLWQKK